MSKEDDIFEKEDIVVRDEKKKRIERRCPFCAAKLTRKDIIEKKIINPKQYLVTYKCPKCQREISVIIKRLKEKDREGEVTFNYKLYAKPEKADILIRRFSKKEAKKQKGKPKYIEHNIVDSNANIEHIGIHGINGWNHTTQFKNKKGEDLEFTEKELGKTTHRWKKVSK